VEGEKPSSEMADGGGRVTRFRKQLEEAKSPGGVRRKARGKGGEDGRRKRSKGKGAKRLMKHRGSQIHG